MAVITLSATERRKFASWLEQDAESNKLLIEQLAKLGPGGDLMAPRMKTEMAAALIIAGKLRGIEDASIGTQTP